MYLTKEQVMASQTLVYAAVFFFVTSLYGLITFGVLSSDFAEHLTAYNFCVTFVYVAVVNVVFAAYQYRLRNTVEGPSAPTYLVLAAVGSCLVALACLIVVIVELTLSRASALRAIDLTRDASLIGIGLSTLLGLCFIGLSINQTVKEAMRDLEKSHE